MPPALCAQFNLQTLLETGIVDVLRSLLANSALLSTNAPQVGTAGLGLAVFLVPVLSLCLLVILTARYI